MAVLVVCIVSGVCFLLSSYIGSETVAFILLVTLSIIAMFFDIVPVLITAFISALIWDYFFILPRFNLRVGNTEDKIMLSMYFVIALMNAVLTFKIRQIEKKARQEEEKTKTLHLYNVLFNSVSHEFRTPLATVIGATDILLDDTSALSFGDKKELLKEISIASLKLNQHVENLLNMSRLETGFLSLKKDWCDINELVYKVVERFDELIKNHTIKIDVRSNQSLFKLDAGLIEQVLYNLIHNAILYTPEQTLINIFLSVQSNDLVIVVEDNGSGFPHEETNKVFEKFYRLKNVHHTGTGLGLSIVKGFVEAHNGTVQLQNKKDGGAKFIIHIPACRTNVY